MTRDQFLNIVAFLILIEGGAQLLGKSPDYIIEKWERYLGDPPSDGPSWRRGLDGGNRFALDQYVACWKVQLDELFPTNEGETE